MVKSFHEVAVHHADQGLIDLAAVLKAMRLDSIPNRYIVPYEEAILDTCACVSNRALNATPAGSIVKDAVQQVQRIWASQGYVFLSKWEAVVTECATAYVKELRRAANNG